MRVYRTYYGKCLSSYVDITLARVNGQLRAIGEVEYRYSPSKKFNVKVAADGWFAVGSGSSKVRYNICCNNTQPC